MVRPLDGEVNGGGATGVRRVHKAKRKKRGSTSAPAASRRLRKTLRHVLLALVAREDEKTIRLLLGMLSEVRKWAEGD
jgi:hypothetical protein